MCLPQVRFRSRALLTYYKTQIVSSNGTHEYKSMQKTTTTTAITKITLRQNVMNYNIDSSLLLMIFL